MPPGAAPARLAAAEVLVEAGVEEVVERQQVVAGDGGAALVFAGRVAAAVVGREGEAQRENLFPGDDDVALAEGIARHDLDVGFCRRHTLEVFQCLFDVAQVEQVASCRGEDVPGVSAFVAAVGETDGTDAAGDDFQSEHAVGEVLCFGQHARGNVAARDDGVLEAGHHEVDAPAAEAAPGRRVACTVGRGERPAEAACRVVEPDFVDREARRLVLGNTLALRHKAWLQTHVWRRFQLLPLRPFAFLLALEFACGDFARSSLRVGGSRAGQQQRKQAGLANNV